MYVVSMPAPMKGNVVSPGAAAEPDRARRGANDRHVGHLLDGPANAPMSFGGATESEWS